MHAEGSEELQNSRLRHRLRENDLSLLQIPDPLREAIHPLMQVLPPQSYRRPKGFTLVEMLLEIATISILMVL